MTLYLQVCGGIFIAVFLILCQRNKEAAVVLVLGACAMGLIAAMKYIRPVLDFLSGLESIGNLNSSMVRILLKASGIGILTEVASLVCTDSGNGSLGKTLHLVGTAVILWLSLPLFTGLMELLQEILGEI